jgi:hypothetical protein
MRGYDMEITIALGLSVLGSVISVATFVLNRRDKAISDTKENNYELIKYQVSEIKEDVKEILSKLNIFVLFYKSTYAFLQHSNSYE